MGDIEVEKESDNESSDSESERSSKFDFGPPLLFSGDSFDMDSLPDNIKSRMESITIRRQMVGKLGQFTNCNFLRPNGEIVSVLIVNTLHPFTVA